MLRVALTLAVLLTAAPAAAQNSATITVEGDPQQVPASFASRLCGVPVKEIEKLPKGQPVCDVDQHTADISTYPGVQVIEAERNKKR